ncbi:MAG: hypothetical protein IJK81_05690 [Selenomonadaceae bacterium]|nr:hypothetical protein [Selenomonadaceae bacterium]
MLAYRNIKNNTWSNSAGTDKLTIADIGNLTPEEVTAKFRYIVSGTKRGIWDRLIQQCFEQVLEPICEAQFSKHSYGFRPNRSVENAISDTYQRMQLSKLHYVIEFDIKEFFDNVNHAKPTGLKKEVGKEEKLLRLKKTDTANRQC